MDWFNSDLWGLAIAQWQAGFNMIPGLGWQQALSAWAADKIKD